MAMRLNSIYEDLIDWTARVRGATLPAEFAYAVELLGDVGGHTISAYRRFVDTFVAQNDRLPEQIAMGKPMTPDLTVTFSTPDEMVEAIRAELRRVAGVFGRRPRPDGSRTGQPATRQPCPTPPPSRVAHVANANTNGNGNAIQLGQHGIDGLIRDQGWRRVPSAARNSLSGSGCEWPAVGGERVARRKAASMAGLFSPMPPVKTSASSRSRLVTRARRPPQLDALAAGNWLAPPAGPP
jgi:hypothetical protein